VKPANAAADTLPKKVNSYTSKTTDAEQAKDLAPAIAAFQKSDNALLRVDWPPAMAADVKALVRAWRSHEPGTLHLGR
jgi:hypothetical protein